MLLETLIGFMVGLAANGISTKLAEGTGADSREPWGIRRPSAAP